MSICCRWNVGFTVRFRDCDDMLQYKPRMLEFHFTDQDLDEHYPGDDYSASSDMPLKLVVHAPEFWDRTLVDLCSLDERQRVASRNLLQKTINLTREMAPYFVGTPKVVIHPGAMSLDHPIRDKAALYANLRRSVEELDYSGVELLLENLPPHPWYFGGQWLTNAFMDAYEIRDFLVPLRFEILLRLVAPQAVLQLGACRFLRTTDACCCRISDICIYQMAPVWTGRGCRSARASIDWIRFFRVLGDYHGTMIPEIWRGHQRQGEGFLIAIQRLSKLILPASRTRKKHNDIETHLTD